MNSLDPRVQRLPKIGQPGQINPKVPLDQFGTFEVFVQPKEGKPFQHEGIVHAPDLEMAYVLAKEAFTRRFTCVSLYAIDTRNVYVSQITEGNVNVYDSVPPPSTDKTEKFSFEVYHLLKRGKQHIHAGNVDASTPEDALSVASQKLKTDKVVYNVWVFKSSDVRFTKSEDKDFWATLPEKKFRDAADYKGGDKLKQFLERSKG